MSQSQYYNHFVYNNTQASVDSRINGFIDVHCHCLAGIDDGPADISDSLALCRSIVDNGISSVIATPHQLGQYDLCNQAEQIREAVFILNTELQQRQIPLKIFPGADIRLDERICRLFKEDKILTLADKGKYLLIEMPFEVLIDIEPLIIELADIGIETIISHPERHRILRMQPEIISKWLNHSAHLQITAGSLLGDFGETASHFAWNFLYRNMAAIVATDCHNLSSRRPRMASAFNMIKEQINFETARRICIDNPSRILQSKELIYEIKENIDCYGVYS